jgi:hypothetical protein
MFYVKPFASCCAPSLRFYSVKILIKLVFVFGLPFFACFWRLLVVYSEISCLNLACPSSSSCVPVCIHARNTKFTTPEFTLLYNLLVRP